MADYLTRLVERTLQLSPTVRPDILPSFVPETGGPPLAELMEGRASDTAPDGYSPPRTTDRGDVIAGYPSHQTRNAEERAIIEHRSAGDESPRVTEGPGRRSSSPPTYTPSSDEAVEQARREPEAPEIFPDHRDVPLPSSPTSIPETVGDTDARTGTSRRPTREANVRPEESPGDHAPPSPNRAYGEPEPARDEASLATETTFATSPRRRQAGSAGVRAPAAPQPDTRLPDRKGRSGREGFGRESTGRGRPAVPEHPVSDAARVEGPASPTEFSSPEDDERVRTHAAPDRAEQDISSRSSRRAVSEAPVVPVARRQVGASAPESVAPDQTGVAERIPPRTVNVTIGRVEVRAIPQAPEPAQPLPESKPVPVLSLDDYLRQHNGT